MFSATFTPNEVMGDDYNIPITDTTIAGTVELTYGGSPVMEWDVTLKMAYLFMADKDALDRFVAGKFRDVFTKTEKLPVE